MAADGTVVITADIDDKKAQRELDKLEKKIVELENQIDKAKSKRLPLVEQAEKLGAALGEAESKLKEMQEAPKGTFSKEQLQEANDTVKARRSLFNDASRQVERYDRQIARSNEKLEEAQTRAGELTEILASGRAGRGVAAIAENVKSRLLSTLEAVGGVAKRLPGVLVQAAKKLNVFAKVARKLEPALRRIGGLVRRVFIFSVITAGLRQLRTLLSDWFSQNDQLAAALGRLKSALATAFYPVYEAAIPAITALINALTRAIAALAQFTALLFGTTATQAQANAKALNQQAKATRAAGSAAKEAASQLASFDELNRLSDNGGGGGGAAEDIGAPQFDLIFKELQIKSWGEAISAFLDKLIAKVNQLPAVFKDVAQRVNKFWGELFDALTFPGLAKKASTLGELLADALNGLVRDINWRTIGAAIGAGLNLALSFAVGFIYSFDWINLGASLGEMFNGLVFQIDWYKFGQLLWAGFKIGIETLAGFILNTDMKQLAQAASQTVIGFLNSITETISHIDWQKIGNQIADFIGGVDYGGVASALFEGVGAALAGLAAFLWGLIETAWDEVVQWWYDVAYEDGQFTIEGLYEGISYKLASVAYWIWDNIFRPFIEGFEKVFKINSPAKVMLEPGGAIIEGLFKGITDALSSVGSWIKTNIFDPIWNGIKTAFGINGNTSEKLKEAGTALANGLANGVKSGIDAVKTQLNSIIEVVEKAVNSMIEKLNGFKVSIPAIEIAGTTVTKAKTLGFNIPRISIPRLAEGAVIPPNREFMAVLGDQRRGTNIEAPEDLIRQIVREEGGGANAEVVSLMRQMLEYLAAGQVIEMDGREFGRATARSVKTAMRTGAIVL